jgi:methylated-DNA-[protein]-cysteine S-methyltransferase
LGDSPRFELFETEFGHCALVWNRRGIQKLLLPAANAAELRQRLKQELDLDDDSPPPPQVRRAMLKVTRRLAGSPQDFKAIRIDIAGHSRFAQRVYAALRKVGSGKTVTYAELGAMIGAPKAARAVGRAMASNPLCLIVPCHRVIAADGRVGGFSAHGGAATKAQLLAIEGVLCERGLSGVLRVAI